MIAAQAAQETRQLLRNGEQLTLTLIIPLLLLAAFSLEPLIDFGGGYTRIDFLTPGVIALAVMSTAFTSQAIATGFERRYGVLKRLGATPLSRPGLIAAKTVTVIGVELLQAAIILLVALALGWSPDASPAAVVVVPLLVLLGTAAFSGFALLLAGTLRAEATLAAANLIYVVLLGIGGVVFPLTKFPRGARPLLELLPTGALSTGLRDVLANAAAFPVKDVAHPRGLGGPRHRARRPLLPVGVGHERRRAGVPPGPAPAALPAGLVLAGAVSVQSGAGIADRLFSQLPPAVGHHAAAVVRRADHAHRGRPGHRPRGRRPRRQARVGRRCHHAFVRYRPGFHELRDLPGVRARFRSGSRSPSSSSARCPSRSRGRCAAAAAGRAAASPPRQASATRRSRRPAWCCSRARSAGPA